MANKSPRGEFAGRQLKKHRQKYRWSDYNYIQKQLGLKYKADPLGGAAMASGIVLEKVGREERKPNSGIRKCVRVQLKKNAKTITAFLPGDGTLNFVSSEPNPSRVMTPANNSISPFFSKSRRMTPCSHSMP